MGSGFQLFWGGGKNCRWLVWQRRRWKEAEKNMILKLVLAAKYFLLSELIPQVEKIPPLVVGCSVGGIVVARSFVDKPC